MRYLKTLTNPPMPLIVAFLVLVNVTVAWMADVSLTVLLLIGAPLIVAAVLVLPRFVRDDYASRELKVMTAFTTAWSAILIVLALIIRPI